MEGVIDIHTHFMPKTLPDFNTRYGYSGFVTLQISTNQAIQTVATLSKGAKTLCKVPTSLFQLEERLMFMEANNIQTQILSPIPSLFSYWAKADDTADLCRIVNNSVAKEISRVKLQPIQGEEEPPPRFLGLGIVPMQAPELAVIELERCIKELGFCGVVIGTHVNEWNLDATELAPFWAACEEFDCPVFVHPWDMEITRKDRKFWMDHILGMPHETNRAITTMILGGVLEKFPKLRLCFAEGGGSFPYIQGRVQQSYIQNPEVCSISCDVEPHRFLGKFFCDTVIGSSVESLGLLLKVVGDTKVVFGSNYPFNGIGTDEKPGISEEPLLAHIRSLSSELKEKIERKNAMDFLGLAKSD